MVYLARASVLLRYTLFILIVMTPVLLIWQHVGMKKVFALDEANGHIFTAHDDRPEGGTSVATITRQGKTTVLDCRLEKKYAWPFCEISILLAEMPEGVDLTAYDSIHFDIAYSGPGTHAVRFYLRNFEEGISKPGDSRSVKVNQIEFDVPADGKIGIPLRMFHVASWWVLNMKVPLSRTDMRIDRVPFVELTTGSLVVPGDHRIEVKAIEFHGKWISKAMLLSVLVGAWFIFGIGWLIAELLTYRVRLNASRARESKLRSINQALQLETKELAGQARIDPLTGALNREGLRDFLMKQWQGEVPLNPSLCVIFADLDRFKHVNDAYGHAVGDDVLRLFARLVNGEIRATDRLVRWGGEEFLIVCPGTELVQGKRLAEKLRYTIAQFQWPQELQLTCSFGVAAHLDGEDFGDMIKRADGALYKAKAEGRDRVEMT